MKKAGFWPVNRANTTQCQAKALVLKGELSTLDQLEELQLIRQQRMAQMKLLQEKTGIIRHHIVNQGETQLQSQLGLSLLETVSSLQQINRRVYALNSREQELQWTLKHEQEVALKSF